MSSFPLLKYVDAPATTATVRYDFNDQAPNPATNPVKKVTAFDPGVPTLEGDPDAVGQTWGFRGPSITHTVKGTKAQAMAALSAVSKEQLRRTNWLLFQPAAAQQPVWYKTYRTGYQPITLDQVYVRVAGGGTAPLPDTWQITVPMVAEAFAYGARVDIPTVTLGNSLSAGNPMRYLLPALKGDAPTGLRAKITPLGTNGYMASVLLALVAADTTVTDTTIDIGTGDVWTAGTNTGAPVTNAAYLGGQYRLASPAISDLTAGRNFSNRLAGTLAAAPPAGHYKVMLRCEADPQAGGLSAETYIFALGQSVAGSYRYGPTVTLNTPSPAALGGTAYTFQGWVDLGDFTFPFGNNLPPDVTSSPAAPLLSLKVGTANNRAGAVRLDCFKLIPLDGPLIRRTTLLKSDFESNVAAFVSPATGPYISVSATWDADQETFWGNQVSGGALVEGSPSMHGYFPVADPADTQTVLVCMPTARGRGNATDTGTAVATTWSLDLSYYPRYLHVGDGT